MAGSAEKQDRDDDPHKREIERRLGDLGRRLDETRAQRETRRDGPGGKPRALALAIRAVSELVGAIIVGGAIGWGLDWWLDTSPVLLLIFFLLGFAAGVLNVLRALKQGQNGMAGEEK
jgi:ATP synthase protein I